MINRNRRANNEYKNTKIVKNVIYKYYPTTVCSINLLHSISDDENCTLFNFIIRIEYIYTSKKIHNASHSCGITWCHYTFQSVKRLIGALSSGSILETPSVILCQQVNSDACDVQSRRLFNLLLYLNISRRCD